MGLLAVLWFDVADYWAKDAVEVTEFVCKPLMMLKPPASVVQANFFPCIEATCSTSLSTVPSQFPS